MKVRRRGSSLVEAALTLGVFLMTVISIMDLTQLTVIEQALVERARVGARYAALRGINPTQIVNVVLYNSPTPADGARPWLNLTPGSVSVERLDANTPADRVQVSIQNFEMRTFSPFLHRRILPHTFTATIPVESLGQVN
jgi:hypothetical protein